MCKSVKNGVLLCKICFLCTFVKQFCPTVYRSPEPPPTGRPNPPKNAPNWAFSCGHHPSMSFRASASESRNLRISFTSQVESVRRSFDSLRSLRMTALFVICKLYDKLKFEILNRLRIGKAQWCNEFCRPEVPKCQRRLAAKLKFEDGRFVNRPYNVTNRARPMV